MAKKKQSKKPVKAKASKPKAKPKKKAAPKSKGESLSSQVARLASFITQNIPGEPSQNQGAIDTAIRIMLIQENEMRNLRERLAAAEAKHTPAPPPQVPADSTAAQPVDSVQPSISSLNETIYEAAKDAAKPTTPPPPATPHLGGCC